MKKLLFMASMLMLTMVVSCSDDENEKPNEKANKFGTYITSNKIEFNFDEVGCPYIDAPKPTFSEEELMNLLVGHKWAEVKDSTVEIMTDGTCSPITNWRNVLYHRVINAHADIYPTDSCFFFYSGSDDWQQGFSVEQMKLNFDPDRYAFVADYKGHAISYFRILYMDGSMMAGVRLYFTLFDDDKLYAPAFSYTIYRNEGLHSLPCPWPPVMSDYSE